MCHKKEISIRVNMKRAKEKHLNKQLLQKVPNLVNINNWGIFFSICLLLVEKKINSPIHLRCFMPWFYGCLHCFNKKRESFLAAFFVFVLSRLQNETSWMILMQYANNFFKIQMLTEVLAYAKPILLFM